ncbi:head-tail connector protein, partial [Mycolicibacterium sp.]|uniref:head-tail connector protein n=1 Tax=Mycolicibacterium sp. TaxID=2320850 RepID=UPI00355FC351
MSLSLYAAATVTALTMDEVKAHIRVDFDDDDALIGLYADAAASYAFGLHGWTGRALVNETYEQ